MLFSFDRKKSLFWGSIFIGVTIFCVLGLPFTKWGFLHDDFGVIWHVLNTKLHGVWSFFSEKGATCFYQPSNFTEFEQSFLSVLYRPLYNVFFFVQKLFFATGTYGYYLVMIFFHSINAMLLFHVFNKFFELRYAFFGALYFGFHVSLCDWIGWIAAQQQVINLTFILLVVLFLIQFFASKKITPLLFACFFYIASLFLRETIIVMPVWLLFVSWFYFKLRAVPVLWARLFAAISVFSALNISYIVLRLWLYPLKVMGDGIKIPLSPFEFIKNLQNRFFDLVTMVVDVFNLSWLSGGHMLLKAFLIVLIGIVLCWLFYKNSQKKIIIVLFLGMIPFLWPAILRYYSSRYLYKGLPFIVAIVILLIKFYKTRNIQLFQKISLGILWGILCINGALLFNHLKAREVRLNSIKQAFIELAANPLSQKRPLCFVGLPYEYFPSGVAQAMWVYGFDSSTPIYYDTSSFLWSKKEPVSDPLKIIVKDNIITLDVVGEENSWFNPFNQFCRMGKIINRNVDRVSGSPRSLTYILDEKYAAQKLLFVTWDYKNWRFKILS